MKKTVLLLVIFIAPGVYSQSPLHSVVKTYLRSQPLDKKFSTFITSLQNDPWFTVEEFNRRTDSTFFFLSGTYKNFNPFRYKPKELRLTIAEEEIIHSDSLKTHDTIINLQLLGLADSGIAGMKSVEKEFRRFHTGQADEFSRNTYNAYEDKNGKVNAEIANYFVSFLLIAPVTTAWGLYPETNAYTFTITLRFKLKQNIVNYVLDPGEVQRYKEE